MVKLETSFTNIFMYKGTIWYSAKVYTIQTARDFDFFIVCYLVAMLFLTSFCDNVTI